MGTYCEGIDCSKREKCALHNPGEGIHEYIDWSSYGSCRYWTDKEGNNHSECEHSCGDKGNFRRFEPMTQLTNTQTMIAEINDAFWECINKLLKPAEVELVELMARDNKLLINELWNDVITIIKKHNID